MKKIIYSLLMILMLTNGVSANEVSESWNDKMADTFTFLLLVAGSTVVALFTAALVYGVVDEVTHKY